MPWVGMQQCPGVRTWPLSPLPSHVYTLGDSCVHMYTHVYSASRDRGDGQSESMWTNEDGKRPRLSGSDSKIPSIQLSSSVSSAKMMITSPSSNVSSSSLSASQSYSARHFLYLLKSFLLPLLLLVTSLVELFPPELLASSSDNDSRLSVL